MSVDLTKLVGEISKNEMMFILMNLGNDKFLKITHALKLQESIKKIILPHNCQSGECQICFLQSLVEESEK